MVKRKKRSSKKQTTLTFNNVVTKSLQKITVNFIGTTRHDQFDGKDYLVAPMIMIVEGVLNGTNGPLLYPAEELSKTPAVWNMKPVVVYHPSRNGQGISACDPDIIKNHGVGIIMNAKFQDNKLKAEAWIDTKKAAIVDDRIIDAIENNTIMELSTGLFTDNERVEGEFNGTPYIAIARNYRPDHLALLPDLKGACSIEDGAGFLRLNVSNEGTSVNIDLKETAIDLEGMNWLAKNAQQVTDKLAELISNEMSHSDIWNLLSSMLRKDNEELWIDEVFSSFFVYIDDGVLYKQNYSINDGEVIFIGGREKVIRKTVLTTEDGTVINNENNVNIERTKKMDKDKLVKAIIANTANQYTDADTDALMAMEEEVLGKMIPAKVSNEEVVSLAATDAMNTALNLNNQVETPKKPLTAQEYIDNAPAEVKAMLQNGLSSYAADKKKLIKIIVANEKNTFTEDQLKAKELPELRSLAALAANTKEQKAEVSTLNFAGQADPVENTGKLPEPLPMPTLNFDERKIAVA